MIAALSLSPRGALEQDDVETFSVGSLTRADGSQAPSHQMGIEKCREALVPTDRALGLACSSRAQLNSPPTENIFLRPERCPECDQLSEGDCGAYKCPFAANLSREDVGRANPGARSTLNAGACRV